jgi:4'-phosphopantetheinyl transferase
MQGVDVWRVLLERPADDVAVLHDLLDAAERSRASRFRTERDRRRFIVARSTLRLLLGRYIDTPPDRVRLHRLSGGKPTLAAESGKPDLQFNLSHCDDVALFAFADRDVGIDVERVTYSSDMARVADHFFSPDEAAVCRQLVGAERARFFYRTWVRKEAYLKATGEGFAIEPARVSISEPPECAVTLSDDDGTHRVERGYSIHDVAEVDDHVAAIAIAGSPGTPAIHYRELRSVPCQKA